MAALPCGALRCLWACREGACGVACAVPRLSRRLPGYPGVGEGVEVEGRCRVRSGGGRRPTAASGASALVGASRFLKKTIQIWCRILETRTTKPIWQIDLCMLAGGYTRTAGAEGGRGYLYRGRPRRASRLAPGRVS